jgi:hypothetical protein
VAVHTRVNGALLAVIGDKMIETQRKSIKDLFESQPNEWIPLYEIMEYAAQYNARILELRRSGMCIRNKRVSCKDETGQRIVKSWYMYDTCPGKIKYEGSQAVIA